MMALQEQIEEKALRNLRNEWLKFRDAFNRAMGNLWAGNAEIATPDELLEVLEPFIKGRGVSLHRNAEAEAKALPKRLRDVYVRHIEEAIVREAAKRLG